MLVVSIIEAGEKLKLSIAIEIRVEASSLAQLVGLLATSILMRLALESEGL